MANPIEAFVKRFRLPLLLTLGTIFIVSCLSQVELQEELSAAQTKASALQASLTAYYQEFGTPLAQSQATNDTMIRMTATGQPESAIHQDVEGALIRIVTSLGVCTATTLRVEEVNSPLNSDLGVKLQAITIEHCLADDASAIAINLPGDQDPIGMHLIQDDLETPHATIDDDDPVIFTVFFPTQYLSLLANLDRGITLGDSTTLQIGEGISTTGLPAALNLEDHGVILSQNGFYVGIDQMGYLRFEPIAFGEAQSGSPATYPGDTVIIAIGSGRPSKFDGSSPVGQFAGLPPGSQEAADAQFTQAGVSP